MPKTKKEHNRIKELQEYQAVTTFLTLMGIMPHDSNFIKKETSTDFEYKCNDILKFQITTPDGEPQKLLRNKIYNESKNYNEVYEKIIKEPIEKKTKKYKGKGVSDVILIIHTIIEYPLIESVLRKHENDIKELVKNSGFKLVYLLSLLGELKKVG